MPSIIDLHTHSNYSDGRQAIQEVVTLAAQNGVTYLAVADHDSIRNIEAAVTAGKKLGVYIIPAIEITTTHNNKVIHILGYGCDVQNKELADLLTTLSNTRQQAIVDRLKQINKRLLEEGRVDAQVDVNEFVVKQNGFFNKWKLAEFLMEANVAQTWEQALEYVGKVKINTDSVTTERGINIVRQAGGLAVLAHPLGPKISLKVQSENSTDQEQCLQEFVRFGLQGLECYQPSHSPQDTEQALVLAKKYNLLVTGGTDWHGPIAITGSNIKEYIPYYANHPGDLDIPKETQENIIKAIEQYIISI